jgi:hypothetical protein
MVSVSEKEKLTPMKRKEKEKIMYWKIWKWKKKKIDQVSKEKSHHVSKGESEREWMIYANEKEVCSLILKALWIQKKNTDFL